MLAIDKELRTRYEAWDRGELADAELVTLIQALWRALESAAPVAEAVKYCAQPPVRLSFWADKWHVSYWRGPCDEECDSAPTLPEAVAALRKRVEGGAK